MTTLSASSETARPIKRWDYFTLNIYWFALSFLWNSMGPILLPILVTRLVSESDKGGALGTLSAIGLIIATIVQPIAGAYTDTRTTRFGKRRPYIVGGTSFDVIFLIAIVFAPSFPVLLLAYAGLQIVSNIAHGPYQAYIPELVADDERGKVTGVKQFLEMFGAIVTALVIGNLAQEQTLLSFALIIAVLLIAMALTALFVREQPFTGATPIAAPAPTAQSVWQTLFYSRDFFLWLVSRLLILLALNLIRNYLLFFFDDVLNIADPAKEVGNLLAILGIAVALVAYPAGALSDRWGRKPLVVVAGLLGALGAVLMMTANAIPMVIVSGLFLGVSIGIFLSANWAWGTDLIPQNAGGRLLGISNIATAGSGVLAGIGGFMLDFFNKQAPNSGYTALYLTAAICYILGTVVVLGVQDIRRKA
jgi:Na+/melibiose symporter-like transporter